MDDLERLVDAEEAGKVLGLKPPTVRRLAAAHELPVVRPTGKRALRFRLRDLMDLMRLRTDPMRQKIK